MFTQPISTSTATALTVSTHLSNTNQIPPALLATLKVIIKIKDIEYIVKALVDQGSLAAFLSQELAQVLPIPQRKMYVDIFGIGKVHPKQNIKSVSDLPQIYLADTNFLMSEKIDLLLMM